MTSWHCYLGLFLLAVSTGCTHFQPLPPQVALSNAESYLMQGFIYCEDAPVVQEKFDTAEFVKDNWGKILIGLGSAYLAYDKLDDDRFFWQSGKSSDRAELRQCNGAQALNGGVVNLEHFEPNLAQGHCFAADGKDSKLNIKFGKELLAE